jgi:hypothetical protein
MKALLRALLTIIISLVIAGILSLLYIYSGAYNIAASVPHAPATEKLLNLIVDSSIENHAKSVSIPNNFKSIDFKEGFPSYDAMCVGCHGAPGIGRSEIGQGLYPMGPSLFKRASGDEDEDVLSPSELFWIVKNGIKMTGMPAFGKTHSDEKIWQIVPFLEALPNLSYYDYVKLRDSASSENHERQ